MSREQAIARARQYFESGGYVADLSRRVAIPTESQNDAQGPALLDYLTTEMQPTLEKLGFVCKVMENPIAGRGPFLFAERMENPGLQTVLSYGHGDVVLGYAEQWREGITPWETKQEGDKLYGRGTADNKGQHSINIGALAAVLAERGKLGFNIKFIIETGEEVGSPGLREYCEQHLDMLKADLFLASDGPRLAPDRPTLFMGSRGAFNFDLTVDLREGGHHSGNWGGLLANPAVILTHALASLTTASGQILVPEWRPPPMPASVKAALEGLTVDGGEDAPEIDAEWGEPGFTAAEKVFGWNSFEILAFTSGNPQNPVNAIPPRASAHCQLRFVVGSDPDAFIPAAQKYLAAKGFGGVQAARAPKGFMQATRLDPDHPWVRWAADSIVKTSDKNPAILPNLGGSLPNDVFSEVLGLPTVWVPHSYASCSQHAPNEHLLLPVAKEGLEIMSGLFWDLGEPGTPR